MERRDEDSSGSAVTGILFGETEASEDSELDKYPDEGIVMRIPRCWSSQTDPDEIP